MTQMYFQKGFGLGALVAPALLRTYASPVVERLRQGGFTAAAGDLRLTLAREFGFCYGVDRAVEYAYETRERFPDRRIFLCGEIVHNPDVNARLQEMGITILSGSNDPAIRHAEIGADDVVILPAFGVTVPQMADLTARRCVLVDTTCGSVLNVWKKVRQHARNGFTVVIHGKHYHEETRATVSQALTESGAHYLCLRDVREAAVLCAFLRGELEAADILAQFAHACSPGFDPDRDLQRIGLANQTTMPTRESLAVQEMLREAMRHRHGEAALAERFRAFDTICSATQDRQDAIHALLDAGGLDRMLVVGGYNSSNTQALAALCAPQVPTFHVRDASCIQPAAICHRPVGGLTEVTTSDWLPEGRVTVGLTAGASTPDSVTGEVVERILAVRGHTAADLR